MHLVQLWISDVVSDRVKTQFGNILKTLNLQSSSRFCQMKPSLNRVPVIWDGDFKGFIKVAFKFQYCIFVFNFHVIPRC